MSEEIMFADMLNHYSLKTSEISDMLNTMVTYLNKSVSISREAWKSTAADRFVDQIERVQQDIVRANNALDELMRQFNAVKSNELDTQIEGLNSEISASKSN